MMIHLIPYIQGLSQKIILKHLSAHNYFNMTNIWSKLYIFYAMFFYFIILFSYSSEVEFYSCIVLFT
ncbi:unnamed protein product, partial [Arabidopsis halleri]